MATCPCATLLCMLETLYPEPKAKKYFDNPYLEKKKVLSPDMGLEPMTLRLKVWCSTDWANRAAHTVNQVKFEASNDFYASTRKLRKVGNQLPNTSNMLWNFNLALSKKCKVCYFYSALFFLIFILPFSTAAQTNFSTLFYYSFRLLSNKWSQGF